MDDNFRVVDVSRLKMPKNPLANRGGRGWLPSSRW